MKNRKQATLKLQKHRVVRWIIQLIFLLIFVFAFVNTRYGIPIIYQNILFRSDPLVFLVTNIASRTIIASTMIALLLVLATLVFGRFFCGFICPLGTMIDIFDASLKKRLNIGDGLRNVKYLFLFFLVMAAVWGISFLHFLDPLTIFERSLTLVFHPVVMYLTSLFTLNPGIVYTETAIALVVIATVLGLNFLQRRFWCRNLCPLGGLLALISKFSIFKFSFLEGCTQCRICDQVCPTGAISYEAEEIDAGECIECLRCQYECPGNTIKYRINLAPGRFDMRRRQLISTLGISVLLAPLARTLLHQRLLGRLIRPPGSLPESDFLNSCIHCGKCLKICPTNGLQPCLLEAGVNGLWTPRLAARIGGCEKNCNMCGQICPTSAIRKLPLEEKTYVKIGTAVIDRARCIAWEQDKVCLICDEACPYNAISSLNETIHGTTLLRPFVDERICTGCGLCEARCPIEGRSAIEIFSIGEERKRRGSYITEEKVKLRACEEKVEDIPSGFIIEN